MSFQPPNSRQEIQNRKILEDLQQQKLKMLQSKQLPTQTAVTTAAAVTQPTPNHSMADSLSSSKRTALQHAHSHSVGYFITQDSSFGNLILPVIPRIEK